MLSQSGLLPQLLLPTAWGMVHQISMAFLTPAQTVFGWSTVFKVRLEDCSRYHLRMEKEKNFTGTVTGIFQTMVIVLNVRVMIKKEIRSGSAARMDWWNLHSTIESFTILMR